MKLDWNKLSARERDGVVAEKVMGFTPCDRRAMGWGDGPRVWLTGNEESPTYQGFNPSERIDQAWLVVGRMREKGLEMELMTSAPIAWECSFENERHFHSAKASTAPEAICLAACRAEGVEV